MNPHQQQQQSLVPPQLMQQQFFMNMHGFMQPQPQFFVQPPPVQTMSYPSALPVNENISSSEEDDVKEEADDEEGDEVDVSEHSLAQSANRQAASFEPDLEVVTPSQPSPHVPIDPKPAGQRQVDISRENFAAYYYHFMDSFHLTGSNKHCRVQEHQSKFLHPPKYQKKTFATWDLFLIIKSVNGFANVGDFVVLLPFIYN